MSRVAIVTGVAGQDGSYLTELLLGKGYTVYGLMRFSSHTKATPEHPNFHLVRGDVTDSACVASLLKRVTDITTCERIEVYNLAAQSQVKVSFEQPEWTTRTDALSVLNILEAIRLSNDKRIRFYQAGTSEMFGKVQEVPQTETTPFYPRSPYGCAKVYAFWITKNYREAHGLFACTGILFNHESERRGEEFVTRKITKAIGTRKFPIRLGNLEAQRDWGYAPDYVEAMWRMLQLDSPNDYVVSTNETHTIYEFVEKAFGHIGVKLTWDEDGTGRNVLTGEPLVVRDPAFYRPAEVDLLIGDSTKFRQVSGWAPSVSFDDIVRRMVEGDDTIRISSSSDTSSIRA
jgi:GDPmannose 4,6-dehydratase